MRRSQLCPGPSQCPDVLTEDPQASEHDALPCSECPAQKLEDHLGSPYGQGMSVAVDLDFALHTGISITLREINYREFCLLRLLTEERNRLEREQIEKASKSTNRHVPH